MTTRIKAKAAKVTMTVDSDDFPWDAVPPPGTPGGKNVVIDMEVDHGGGVLTLSIKGGTAQKALVTHQQTPQGGFVILQGKMIGDKLEDGGVVYQPKKVETAEQAGG